MNEEAKTLYEESEKDYKEAKRLMQEGDYTGAIDRFHDCVEKSLKSLLTLYGVPYPPKHGIHEYLPELRNKLPQDEVNYIFYSQVVLPPFIAIQAMLSSIRNMVRYPYKGVPSNQICDEGVAKAVEIMIEYHYGSLKYWILDMLYKPEQNQNEIVANQ